MYNNTPTPSPPTNGGGYNDSTQTVSLASAVMKRVYLKMTLGLLVTAFSLHVLRRQHVIHAIHGLQLMVLLGFYSSPNS